MTEIIKADLACLNAIYKIELESFTAPWSKESISATISSDLNTVFVATENGITVGFICISSLLDEAEILNIAVSPKMRGCGIASALMSSAISYAEESEIKTVFLEVRESNAAARALYEKFGFTTIGKRKKYYTSPTEDAVLMNRSI